VNSRPIIGILTQPEDDLTYIAASYVKWIESGGARVVPIIHSSSSDVIKEQFQNLNGVVFPGGAAEFEGDFLNTAKTIYDLAIAANDAGDFFPIWGTCLGFELLCFLTSGEDKSVLTSFEGENFAVPLNFTSAANSSRLFLNAGSHLMNILATEDVTFNNHEKGVSPTNFDNKLSFFYNVLSYNYDLNNKLFVSAMEAKNYPFYGVQFHPEKNLFEWTTYYDIPHFTDSSLIAQYFTNFFVNEARKSTHSYPSQDEEKAALIYNYNPVYVDSKSFEQQYEF